MRPTPVTPFGGPLPQETIPPQGNPVELPSQPPSKLPTREEVATPAPRLQRENEDTPTPTSTPTPTEAPTVTATAPISSPSDQRPINRGSYYLSLDPVLLRFPYQQQPPHGLHAFDVPQNAMDTLLRLLIFYPLPSLNLSPTESLCSWPPSLLQLRCKARAIKDPDIFTYDEAMRSKERPQWLEAAMKEILGLES